MSNHELDELQRELEKTSENLGTIISKLLKVLGATGVVLPKPPRPKLEVVAKLTYGALLIDEALEKFPELKKKG